MLSAMLLAVAFLAGLWGKAPGPEAKAFITIAATVWSLADLFTAFLLLAQFYVTGRFLFGILAAAYTFGGVMTCAFIVAFPGIFRSGPQTLGDEQISSVVWMIWHCTFPALVVCAVVADSPHARVASRRAIGVATGAIALLPLVVAGVLSGLIFAYREFLPHLIIHGQFQPMYKAILLPFVILLNATACCVLVARKRPLTPLLLWLTVAMFSETLDCVLVWASRARYSYAWDTGKLMTVFTASVVLVLIVREGVLLYARLAHGAGIDGLTTLRNRRSYEEHLALVLHNARRLGSSLGLLVVDIDDFKRYNDSYGHQAGDECLRQVAAAIATCVRRPLDMVARYGGEEFVVVLPDTSLAGVRGIADRMRSAVEQLDSSAAKVVLGRVTVSIGIGYTENAQDVDQTMLFETADRALYEAKRQGRNGVVLGSPAAGPAVHPPTEDCVAVPESDQAPARS
jgi:diguanylate cyclase (GGDEF)-like protein